MNQILALPGPMSCTAGLIQNLQNLHKCTWVAAHKRQLFPRLTRNGDSTLVAAGFMNNVSMLLIVRICECMWETAALQVQGHRRPFATEESMLPTWLQHSGVVVVSRASAHYSSLGCFCSVIAAGRESTSFQVQVHDLELLR